MQGPIGAAWNRLTTVRESFEPVGKSFGERGSPGFQCLAMDGSRMPRRVRDGECSKCSHGRITRSFPRKTGTRLQPSRTAGRFAPNPSPPHYDPQLRHIRRQRFLGRLLPAPSAVYNLVSWTLSKFLPRELFAKNPQLFRMDDNGDRDPKVNCCVSNKTAIEIISKNAAECARVLPSTTGRYFFWIDDNKVMCHCPDCRGFTDSDQAVILENALLRAVRTVRPEATLAHLVYANTLEPPRQVKPETGVFLEFAPISRHYMIKLGSRNVTGRRGMTHGQILDYLDANLEVFGAESAQVLEYWLNARMFYR